MIKCKACGKENGDNLWKCEACNFPLHDDERRPRIEKPKPKNYMIVSILLILSCIPTAIVSFIYGLKVNSSFLEGKYDEAETYTRKAKTWVWISVVIGIIITIIFMMFFSQFISKLNPLRDYGEIQKLLKND
ncbi:MAG: hypothetical protein A2231_06420 [Candidatus Firestonebacteria bacterium RIFOXYA2_FULL_40_8]|nr:MAG: hypothetical protein A2231_06420 [Candidatus Firestonebacteria bacterium RIFOXYA2_FULL_40_8]